MLFPPFPAEIRAVFPPLLTAVVLIGFVAGLARNLAEPDLLAFGCLSVLWLAGVISPTQALGGFSNSGTLTIGVMYALSTALGRTGVIDGWTAALWRYPRRFPVALARLTGSVAALSAVTNNTPLVALLMPVVRTWGRRLGHPPSRLLLPLSFATILGGLLTVIGTSTNLVASGVLVSQGQRPFGFFELTWVGLPVALAGLAVLVLLGPRLLPIRPDPLAELRLSQREYLVEMALDPDSPLVGRSVAEGGLRHLHGVYLAEIKRSDHVVAPVAPETRLRAADRLVFAGVVTDLDDLRAIPGLHPVLHGADETILNGEARTHAVEVVVALGSPLVGRTVADSQFRRHYDAAVLAVHRAGERLHGKIGEVELRPGDLLLLLSPSDHWCSNGSFHVLQRHELTTRQPRRAGWIVIVLLTMVGLTAFAGVPLTSAAFAALTLLALTGCITARQIRQSVEWRVLVLIACALGIGQAVESSGLARLAAGGLLDAARPLGPRALLIAVYLLTAVLTEILTHSAVPPLMLPLTAALAIHLGIDPRPLAVVVTIAASASFLSPMGYQTNLMVYGPGGYRLGDYLRLGLPLTAVCLIVTVLVVPLVWPL